MADRNISGDKNMLLERITSLSKDGQGVSCQDFERVLREFPTNDIPIDVWNTITSFASNQMGFWEAEWFYSWSHSPNTKAQSEMQGWKLICRACLDALKDKIPNASEQIEKQHNLTVLRYSIRKAAAFNEATPIRKFTANLLSSASFKLNKIGFHGLASRVYALALYPKGTVGRTSN